MASKLKIIEDVADIVPAPVLQPIDPVDQLDQHSAPDFDIAPTRKRHAGWTADRQRRFIEHLSLTGNAGEASAVVGVASSSAYRLKHKPGAESFSRAWDAALRLSATRLAAIGLDRGINGRVERFYKNGELVMERRIPSDYLLTWMLSRLDPLQFGSPSAKALAAATGDPRERARNDLPALTASFTEVPVEECPCEPIDYLDERLGETGSGEPIGDDER
jgi:hypothetical protein